MGVPALTIEVVKAFLQRLLIGLSFSSCLLTCARARQQPSGLETPWDARKIVSKVLDADEQLKPLFAAIDPKEWYEKKGAPSAYVIQWQTAQRQLTDVEVTSKLLSQKPESLSLALDVYFRLEALEISARSVSEGALKYADRATADKLSVVIAHNFDSRERLRDYIKDLAASTEQNFKIADDEAQRCRAIISREPPSVSGKRSGKN